MSTKPPNAGLRWTGHALIDVGIAGVCVYCNRKTPEEITLEDLDRVSDYLVQQYYGGKLGTFLSCVFMNASFVQPREGDEKRQAFIDHYLRAHRALPLAEVASKRCVFSGLAATSPLVRTHLPLFSGEDVLNFRPDGTSSVPAAGPYIVCLFFLPLASRRAEGRLLAVHADDPKLTRLFAATYLRDNQRLLTLQLPAEKAPIHEGYHRELPAWDATKKRYKFADAKGPRSLVVSDLIRISQEAYPSDKRPYPTAITVYLLSNSGQGPSFESFDMPSGVVSFVRLAAQAPTAAAWESLCNRFKPLQDRDEEPESGPPSKGRSKKKPDPIRGRAGWSRNQAFEELCEIHSSGFTDTGKAALWLRKHILGRLDASQGSVHYERLAARSWPLAELFLTEVIGMNKGRIEAIRAFADKLADWIVTQNDRKLHRSLAFDKPFELQRRLLSVQRQSAQSKLLFGLDEFANVWLQGEDNGFLVRDLICLRVVEKLYEAGYYRQHPEETIETLGSEESSGSQEALG